MKTNELIGAALDWAVAKCEGVTVLPKMRGGCYVTLNKGETVLLCYSTDWAQGGPIIDREQISIGREFASGRIEWAAWTPAPIRDDATAFGYGPTPLIAAMRCYVASKLGDDINMPEELTA
jgi:hypothetical protein